MKTKKINNRLNSLILTTIGCTVGLTGCITTMPMGMPGMMPGSLGASSPAGSAPEGSAPVSGGANWATRGFGSGGIMGVNAEKFASNVHSLEIGKSTKEDALVLLGNPFSKGSQQDYDIWTYSLSNKGANEGFGYLHFKNGKIQYIEVVKTGFSGGSISSESIFKKGTKPKEALF
jgi:hypothetical protein